MGGEGLLFANGAKVNPLTKANTHLVLIFENQQTTSTKSTRRMTHYGRLAPSYLRGQAGHGNE